MLKGKKCPEVVDNVRYKIMDRANPVPAPKREQLDVTDVERAALTMLFGEEAYPQVPLDDSDDDKPLSEILKSLLSDRSSKGGSSSQTGGGTSEPKGQPSGTGGSTAGGRPPAGGGRGSGGGGTSTDKPTSGGGRGSGGGGTSKPKSNRRWAW